MRTEWGYRVCSFACAMYNGAPRHRNIWNSTADIAFASKDVSGHVAAFNSGFRWVCLVLAKQPSVAAQICQS